MSNNKPRVLSDVEETKRRLDILYPNRFSKAPNVVIDPAPVEPYRPTGNAVWDFFMTHNEYHTEDGIIFETLAQTAAREAREDRDIEIEIKERAERAKRQIIEDEEREERDYEEDDVRHDEQ